MIWLVGRIVHRAWGTAFTKNEFCWIVRDSGKSVLLAPLKTTWGKNPVMYAHGTPVLAGETPITPSCNPERLVGHSRTFRAKKILDGNGTLSFHADGKTFFLWDGEPKDRDCE